MKFPFEGENVPDPIGNWSRKPVNRQSKNCQFLTKLPRLGLEQTIATYSSNSSRTTSLLLASIFPCLLEVCYGIFSYSLKPVINRQSNCQFLTKIGPPRRLEQTITTYSSSNSSRTTSLLTSIFPCLLEVCYGIFSFSCNISFYQNLPTFYIYGIVVVVLFMVAVPSPTHLSPTVHV